VSAAVRIALGLGDQELEQRLRPALDADDELDVVLHCLAADQVVHAVDAKLVDIVVVAAGLHRLSDSVLTRLQRARLPVVLLSAESDGAASDDGSTIVLARDVDASTLRQAIVAVARGRRWSARPRPVRERSEEPSPPPRTEALADLSIIAVAGGAGSPGRTILGIGLATALGAVAPTVLMDVDCSSPSVSAYLNSDPTRNICTLAHAVRDDPQHWTLALTHELQPLHPRSPHGWLLSGLPKRELRASLTPTVIEQLVRELARRYRYVILDIGAEVMGMDAVPASHRAALGLAQHVLLVTAADVVSIWHARTAIEQFEHQLGLSRDQMSLVINRHDRRFHHAEGEIEWHLGVPSAQVIPRDVAGMERAVADQNPIVIYPNSRAARAILGLAERIHQGRVRLTDGATEDGAQHRNWRVALAAGAASLLRWGNPS
jgi:MinD-like ATPase involved in chromosome partitioning or flagellar assembly